MLLDRRIFLKSLGIVGGSTIVSCNTMAPQEKLTAYLTPPKEMVPGTAAYYATVCRACPAGCGILVKTREGRPIKLEGNPAHPVNRGKLCARGQAFVQELYSPFRVQKPMLGQGGDSSPVSWKRALDEVSSRLKSAKSVGFVTGLESSTFDGLIRAFGASHERAEHLTLESLALTAMAEASFRLFGEREVPFVTLEHADLVLSFGADILDTWMSPVLFSRQWADRHGVSSGRQMEMTYVGPRRNLTATAADRWVPIAPAVTAPMVHAVLSGVFETKKKKFGAKGAAIADALKALTPATSLSDAEKKIADGLTKAVSAAKSPMVLTGGPDVTGENATSLHAMVLLLNHILGAVGRGLLYSEKHILSKVSSDNKISQFIDTAAKGDVDVLFVHGADPVYSLPNGDAIRNAKFVVALTHTQTATTDAAHLVLPVHHPLESWGDFDVTRHQMGLMQPVRTPLFNSRHAGDLLVDIAKAAGNPIGTKDYKTYLVAKWTERVGVPELLPPEPEVAPDGGVSDSDNGDTDGTMDAGPLPAPAPAQKVLSTAEWEQMLVHGGRFDAPAKTQPPALKRKIEKPATRLKAHKGVSLIASASPLVFDGRGARLDWLRETPEPMLQTAWEFPLEVSADVAASKGIGDGDTVSVNLGDKSATVRAIVSGDLAPNTVVLPFGGGSVHIRDGGDTANPISLIGPLFDASSGVLTRVAGPVTLKRIAKGELVSVMGSPDSKGRLLALSIGLEALEAGRVPIITRHGEVYPDDKHYKDAVPVPMPHQEKGGERPADNMYSLQEHAAHRWGIVVDLDKCTGCSACVVSCYAENNIPVVGKREVARGRELSWIRIEKHVFKEGNRTRVQFLPVMCQQCDNAPCETVCPVFASSHTTDGLNAQIYNRCVGTRYCANNCPYKVRRFNYFDYERKSPANQQLNPDVTVRSRGVMEKCTFCIQRIRDVLNRHKVSEEPIRDGEIVPACVQTCPTGALSFGDFNRPEFAMTKSAKSERGYRLLDYQVNTRPGVVYLRKVLSDKEGSDT